MLTVVDPIIIMTVCDENTSWYFHFHWYEEVYYAPITNFMCGSVGSSHICIPKFWHWFGCISDFPFCFQTINLDQTLVLITILNLVPMQWHWWRLVYSLVIYILGKWRHIALVRIEWYWSKVFSKNNGYHHGFPFHWMIPYRKPCTGFYILYWLPEGWFYWCWIRPTFYLHQVQGIPFKALLRGY